jgi:hypothetical protein
MLSSDQQIPYQDDRALKIWFDVMKWMKPDVVDYLGDTSDQFCFSRFQEGTTRDFMKQFGPDTRDADILKYIKRSEKPTADFYKKTRKMLPNAELFSALGNHDIRVFNYADKYLHDVFAAITPEALWGLDNLGIDYIHYDDKPKHRFGDIFVHHGLSALGDSVSSVKSDVDKLGVSLIRGHSHRMGAYYETYELRDEIIRGYEIGHMCQVDSEGFMYSQIHNWQQGFAVGLVHNDRVHIQLVEINRNYEALVFGKLFTA